MGTSSIEPHSRGRRAFVASGAARKGASTSASRNAPHKRASDRVPGGRTRGGPGGGITVSGVSLTDPGGNL
jgi:hypothetical protein